VEARCGRPAENPSGAESQELKIVSRSIGFNEIALVKGIRNAILTRCSSQSRRFKPLLLKLMLLCGYYRISEIMDKRWKK